MKNYGKAALVLIALFSLLQGLSGSEKEIGLIKRYYELLRYESTLKEAYEISTKKVSYETFKSWYENVVFSYPFDIKSAGKSSYSFKVFMSWYDPNSEGTENDTVSVFQVEMKVAGDRIISSKSKSLHYYVEQELPYKDNLVIEVANNVKKMQKELSLLDKAGGKKRLIKAHSYDRFGVDFNNLKIVGDIFVVPFNSFDFVAVYAYDLTTLKRLDFDGVHLAISPDGDYIFSYSDIPAVTGTPLTLEYYKGKRLKKVIIRQGEVTEVRFFKEQGRLKLQVRGNPEATASGQEPFDFEDGEIYDVEELRKR